MEHLLPPKRTYGLHLVPKTQQLVEKWRMLGQATLIHLIVCLSERMRMRFLRVVRNRRLQEQREKQMDFVKLRAAERSKDVGAQDAAQGRLTKTVKRMHASGLQ